MHRHSIESWTHQHVFLGERHEANERRTLLVVGLTAAMMVAEIAGGALFGSMALLADGFHMSTHAGALGISAAAYAYARRHRDDPRFAFGTGKLGDLAAFASAIVLVMIAALIGYESLVRLARPVPIAYGEAIAIAAVGLAVNLVSAWMLRDHGHPHQGPLGGAPHSHDHDDIHGPAGGHRHHSHATDVNLRSAYVHVLADAATSILAIAGLLAARGLDLPWIDPVVGLAGTLVIVSWAYGLIRDAGATLLDVVPDRHLSDEVRRRLETDGDRVTDLHVWRLGPGHQAAVISLVSDRPQEPSAYKRRLAGLPCLSHVTVEVQTCPAPAPPLAA